MAKRKDEGPRDAQPQARALFARLAQPFIAPITGRGEGLRLIFDIETDGLLDVVTKVHCIVVANLDGDRVDEYGPEQIPAALEHLARADYLTGHNIQGYDLPVLRKLYGWAPKGRIVDTLVAARLILPNLTDIDGEVIARTKDAAFGHERGRYSIEAFGARLGVPKIGAEITDWSQWTPELQARCVGDVAINRALWLFLQPDGYSRAALDLEHRVAAICEQITADGVPFDRAAAERLCQQISARQSEIETKLQEQFPGVKLASRGQIGQLLESRGWVPEKRTPKTGKPSIGDELLETIGETYPEFSGLSEYYVLKRRIAQIATGNEAWMRHVGTDGRIRGSLIHIGTPHSRAAHFKPNLAQIPNPKRGKPLAAECRSVFRTNGDWAFVSCDQGTLQDRGFAHYLAAFDTGAYARSLVSGSDQHWQCATALRLTDEKRDKENKVHTLIREGAKQYRYSFLFGAGALRGGQIIAGVIRSVEAIDPNNPLLDPNNPLYGRLCRNESHPGVVAQVGRLALDSFLAATPGLGKLRTNLAEEHRRRGWVEGLDGRRVPTDADYKALNRIVTASEAIICKRWLVDVYDELCSRFRYGPDGEVYLALWIHDELVAICKPELAETVGEILVRHAVKAGDPYGFRVPLDAEFKIGRSWAGEPLREDFIAETADIASPHAAASLVERSIMIPTTLEVTVFTRTDGPLTKHIYLDDTGKVISNGATLMSRGRARRVQIRSMRELASLIASLRSNDAIALGALRADLPDQVDVVTVDKLNGNGSIARTADYLQFRAGAPALMLIDFDLKGMSPDVAARVEALGGFLGALASIMPALRDVPHLVRRSTSAGLYRTDTSECFPDSGGAHVYVQVRDGADIPRFLADLHERAWLAGLGWCLLGADGKVLDRSIVDPSVGKPERLIYEGPPILKPPLAQERAAPEIFEACLTHEQISRR
jgi:DNA polymerase I